MHLYEWNYWVCHFLSLPILSIFPFSDVPFILSWFPASRHLWLLHRPCWFPSLDSMTVLIINKKVIFLTQFKWIRQIICLKGEHGASKFIILKYRQNRFHSWEYKYVLFNIISFCYLRYKQVTALAVYLSIECLS